MSTKTCHCFDVSMYLVASVVTILLGAVTVVAEPSLREHRNLYNIDFGSYFWKPTQVQPEGGRFKAESIHHFVRLLADNGVDTFVLNPNSKVPWYPSKVVPWILTGYVRDDPEKKTAGGYGPEMLNLLLDLQESNVDWLAESIKASRECGISPWVSVRMNDPHGQAPHLESALHKDAKFRIGDKREWAKLNYQYPEVRNYYFEIIRELVENYDFDGLELDWKRSPVCIPPPASQEQIKMMTAWFAEIRKLTEAKAKKTGRPYYLGMQIPAEYKRLKQIGIDMEAIVKARFVDFICPGNFMQTAWDIPYDRIKAELGPQLTLYGVTDLEIDSNGLAVCDNPPALRGNAAGKLVLGADGIEQYNFFWANDYATAHSALRNLNNLESLRGQTKYYVLPSDGRFTDNNFDRPNPMPVTLEPGKRRTFRLPMCAEPTDRNLGLTIQLSIQRSASPPKVGVCINGSWPNIHGTLAERGRLSADSKPQENSVQAYDYKFGVDTITDGWNEIELKNGGEEPARILHLDLGVK